MRFLDNVAIVTGAASGIGFATARLLAAEGALVFLNDLRADPAAEAVAQINDATDGPGIAVALPGDASNPDFVREAVAGIVARAGKIDVMVNNAGLYENLPAEDYPFENWKRVMAVNADSPFLWSTEVARQSMMARGQGAIVNVASMAGLVAGPKALAYTAAKHAVVGLTRALAVDWARNGIRVNAVCPGLTATEMVLEARAKNPEMHAIRLARVPTGREATPEDQAHAILHLASTQAAATTGLIMNVDSGQLALNSGYSIAPI